MGSKETPITTDALIGWKNICKGDLINIVNSAIHEHGFNLFTFKMLGTSRYPLDT